MLNEILAKHTGLTAKQIAEETERDKYMTAEEAFKYGLIDEVLEEESEDAKKKEKEKKEKK
jgi:ATP-dependent Clp protease protease subunit